MNGLTENDIIVQFAVSYLNTFASFALSPCVIVCPNCEPTAALITLCIT